MQDFLDELETSVHMSSENSGIVEKTIQEILNRKRKSAAKRRSSPLDKRGVSFSRTSGGRMSSFASSRAASMGLRRRSTLRKTTKENVAKHNEELKTEKRRLTHALNDTMEKLGIDNKRRQQLQYAVVKLKGIVDSNLELDEKCENLQEKIDDMDSLLYKFNAKNSVAGRAELGGFGSAGDKELESHHQQLRERLSTQDQAVAYIWKVVDKVKNAEAGTWYRSDDIQISTIDELGSLRLQLSNAPARIYQGHNDPVTDLLKQHMVPSLKDILTFRYICMLHMVRAARAAGCKVDAGLDNTLEACIRDQNTLTKRKVNEV